MANIENQTEALKSAQLRVDEQVIDSLGKLKPIKSEGNLPGVNNVEHDLSLLHNKIIDSSWLTNIVRLSATPSMIRKLAQDKQVAFIIPNKVTELPTPLEVKPSEIKVVQQKEDLQGLTWGIKSLQIDKVWEQGIKGENVLIGHLDTGVDASHPDIKGKVKEFALFDPRGKKVECAPFDSGQHGTHTAGTLIGENKSNVHIGIAPAAKLVSALVLMNGKGTTWQIIKGIEWAVTQKIRVLNMSLGGLGYSGLYEYTLARLIAMGIFVSCSIGNDGLSTTGSPRNLGMACGVGAINHKKEVANFSGGGSVSWYNTLGQLIEVHKPDVVAPGVATYSSLPGKNWDYMNGTSMAAPYVSGLAALLIQAKPTAPLNEIVQAIYSTARHPGISDVRRDSRFGRGIINPMKALEKLVG